MARSDRKQRELDCREKEILDAALLLCSMPDWESVTVEQIATGADVSKGTVYNHFASKDELLFRLMIRFYHGLLVKLRDGLEEGAPREQFRSIIQRGLAYHATHPEYRYIVQYCERADFKERAAPGWRDDFLELDRAFQEWGGPMIERGMATGDFTQRPIQAVMLGIHASFKGAITLLWAGNDWCPAGGDTETIIPAVTDFIMAGLEGRG